jgi:hypothetical protein
MANLFKMGDRVVAPHRVVAPPLPDRLGKRTGVVILSDDHDRWNVAVLFPTESHSIWFRDTDLRFAPNGVQLMIECL